MQQIFAQKIRFKDEQGHAYPDWEEKRLGEVAIKESSSLVASTIKNNKGIYPVFGASGYLTSINSYTDKKAYISIVKDGAGVGRVRMCGAYSSVLGTLDKIKPLEHISIGFLYYLMNLIVFTKYIVGSTIPHIYYRDYAKERVAIPTLPEQHKIADFLTAIDTKIEHTHSQLENMKCFKKALLQQMFI